jgi:chaperone BCS1
MANHLRFDIYDLELTAVMSNSDLRRLLVSMGNRSILVIEDIDCTIELKQREEGEGHDESNSTEQNKGEGKVSTNFQCVIPVSSRIHHFLTVPDKNLDFLDR